MQMPNQPLPDRPDLGDPHNLGEEGVGGGISSTLIAIAVAVVAVIVLVAALSLVSGSGKNTTTPGQGGSDSAPGQQLQTPIAPRR